MPCLLISTSAITWPAERLPPDNNAVVVDELNLQPLISIVKQLKLNLVIVGEKKTPTMSALGGRELAVKVFYQITNIIF